MQNKPRGGQPQYALARDGKPIVGLSRNASDGRYYTTHGKPRRWFGRDFDAALIGFRAWESTQRGEVRTLVMNEARQNTCPYGSPYVVETVRELRPIRDDLFWAQVRSAIVENPALAAEKTGLPLDRLHAFKPIAPSVTLEKIGTAYLNKTPPIHPKYRGDCETYWDEFKQWTACDRVSDLSPEAVKTYRDEVYKAGKGKSARYVNNRFGVIAAVFNHAMADHTDFENVERASKMLAALRRLKTQDCNPGEITPADFGKLMAVADVKWRAMLLTALNMAAYPIDIATLRKAVIDLTKGTIVDRRTKTGVPRVCVLWQRTIAAIKEYQTAEPHHSEYMFIAANGAPYKTSHLPRAYRRLRKNAGVKCEFSHIRDSAQTAAIEAGCDPVHVDLLLGHKTGIRDNYLLRKPSMVKAVCTAIETAYFPMRIATQEEAVKTA